MTSMALDRDLRWTWSKPTSHRKFVAVYEVGMKYEHLKRERVLHKKRTEITPNPKCLRVVFHSMVRTNGKPAPTPSVAGSVKHKLGDKRVQTLLWNCWKPAALVN